MNGPTRTNVQVNVALWLISLGMGLAIAAAGAMKLLVSKTQLLRWGAGWVEDFGSGAIKFMGLTELLGGAAIMLPPAGTVGLSVVAVGAAVVHVRRREPGMIALNIALLALAAFALRVC
jgi:hypothetical protein